MTDHAAVLATFEDVKRVKTRKVWQLIFEVPEERYDMAVATLGGSPQSGVDQWVGIARVDERVAIVPADDPPAPESTETPEETKRVKGGARARRAGILCGDPSFQRWYIGMLAESQNAEFHATKAVRMACNVKSRAELDDPNHPEPGRIWDQIERDYRDAQEGRTGPDLERQANR